MSDQDFPAAHSMDTEWFAVDAHGHVACFETYEAGAIPESAANALDGEHEMSLDDAIMQLGPEDGIEYFVDDLLDEPGGPVYEYSFDSCKFESKPIGEFTGIFFGVLMQLSDESLFTKRAATASGFLGRLFGRAASKLSQVSRIYNSQHILAFVSAGLTPSELQNWIASGIVKRAWVNHSLEPERIGIFKYSHGEVFENWIAGPYLRNSQPARPIKLEQLPESLQSLFRQAHLANADFSRWHAVDPRAAGPCSSWGDSWVELDGTVHRPEEEP